MKELFLEDFQMIQNNKIQFTLVDSTIYYIKGGFPLGEFFRAKQKACFDSFVLL